MGQDALDEERLNLAIRKFLKRSKFFRPILAEHPRSKLHVFAIFLR